MKLWTFLLLCCPAWSQFGQFAATDDGRQVFFVTRLLQRAAPSDAPAEVRAFRLAGGNLELLAERGGLACSAVGSSADGVVSLRVSGDGATTALVLYGVCPAGEPYPGGSGRRAEIRGRHAQILDNADSVSLSRNGKWALLIPQAYASASLGQPRIAATESTLLNLETGERAQTGYPATVDSALSLASDGSVLVRPMAGAVLPGVWKAGQFTELPAIGRSISFLGMSDDGGTVFASRRNEEISTALSIPELVVIDLRTRAYKAVHTLPDIGRYILLAVSNDGRRALFGVQTPTASGPLSFCQTDSGRVSAVTLPGGEIARTGALSGDGATAIVATDRGRVLRLPIDAAGAFGAPEELIPATPYLEFPSLVAPGSLLDFAPPLPGDIDWIGRIQVKGAPLVILRRSADRITAQAPWELPTGRAAVTVDYANASPLVQRQQVSIVDQAPRFPTLPEGAQGVLGGMLLRGDFSGYVTEPPKAGDVVHLYMTGLGRVQGAVETGKPAPLDELRPLAGVLHCRIRPYPSDVSMLYAGLAPGMVGVYQLSMRLAADTPPGVAPGGFECGYNSASYSFGVSVATLGAPPGSGAANGSSGESSAR